MLAFIAFSATGELGQLDGVYGSASAHSCTDSLSTSAREKSRIPANRLVVCSPASSGDTPGRPPGIRRIRLLRRSGKEETLSLSETDEISLTYPRIVVRVAVAADIECLGKLLADFLMLQ